MISSLLTWLSPYKWLIELVAAFSLMGGIAFGIHHFLESEQLIGYNKAKAEYTAKLLAQQQKYDEAQLIAQQKAQEKEQEFSKQLAEAQNEATLRQQKIDELTRTLNTTSGSLRDAIATARNRVSTDSIDALREQANTFLTLFNECQSAYAEMAGNADQHASDVTTLTQAWPK